jgi:hypothetical protein
MRMAGFSSTVALLFVVDDNADYLNVGGKYFAEP